MPQPTSYLCLHLPITYPSPYLSQPDLPTLAYHPIALYKSPPCPPTTILPVPILITLSVNVVNSSGMICNKTQVWDVLAQSVFVFMLKLGVVQ